MGSCPWLVLRTGHAAPRVAKYAVAPVPLASTVASVATATVARVAIPHSKAVARYQQSFVAFTPRFSFRPVQTLAAVAAAQPAADHLMTHPSRRRWLGERS